jgi:hypothetical protein
VSVATTHSSQGKSKKPSKNKINAELTKLAELLFDEFMAQQSKGGAE